MKIYLIRHGESDAMDKSVRQTPDSPLGEKGFEQAGYVAKRFRNQEIDVVFSSTWVRAKQTAAGIAKALGKKLETFEGIHEKEQHPRLYGAGWASIIHNKYTKETEKNFHNLDWKFRGKGESLRDVIARAEKFKSHLIDKHKEQNVIAVTHGIFIRCFICVAVFGKKYDDESFIELYRTLSFNNTGVSLLEYEEENSRWHIRFINDHSHLETPIV